MPESDTRKYDHYIGDDKGIAGVEATMDDILRGPEGQKTIVKDEKGRQFSCPNCGAALTLQLAASQSMTCSSCMSIIDLSQGIGGELKHAVQDEPVQPLIALGSTGTLPYPKEGLILAAGTVSAQGYDPKATIADLDARLAKIGAPKVDGTEVVAGKTVPALFFGERKINNNFDVVDSVRKAHNATATVFVKDGDEFVRVSTNVLTPEGKRGVGTQLARNAAYAAVSKGEQFCGPIDVLGTAFDACYHPVKDAGGTATLSADGSFAKTQ